MEYGKSLYEIFFESHDNVSYEERPSKLSLFNSFWFDHQVLYKEKKFKIEVKDALYHRPYKALAENNFFDKPTINE